MIFQLSHDLGFDLVSVLGVRWSGTLRVRASIRAFRACQAHSYLFIEASA